MVVAEIDRDYQPDDGVGSRVGHKFHMLDSYAATLSPHLPSKVRWRCKDDDGNIEYGGWLLNDSEAEVQLEVLRYCARDVGATVIEVKTTNGWTQEIG